MGKKSGCLYCGGPIECTDWTPGPGLDPSMREFRCKDCKRKFFKIVRPRSNYHDKVQKHKA